MIELKNISYKYSHVNNTDEQLTNINLSIKKGECILLCGRSGCGKTTLTRILNGLATTFFEGQLSGTYLINNKDSSEMTINDLGMLTGNVFQDPRSQFFCTNTTDEIVFGMENRGYSRERMQERLQELCELFPLEKLLDKDIFKLSSGEKQIVAIASVCAFNPQVLIMDEPTANLDTKTMDIVATMLKRLKEQGTTIIIAEHRLHFVRDVFDRAIIMDNGKIIKEITRDNAIKLNNEELNNLGLRLFSIPKLGKAKSITKQWDNQCGIDMIKVDYRTKEFYPLDSVSFHSPYGYVLAIIGNNGAGKSSLCKVLTGAKRQARGDVVYNGLKIYRKIPKQKRSFLVSQDADYQIHSHTVLDEFWAGKKRIYISDNEIKEAKQAIEKFGLKGLENRHPQSLSGGQKQRLLLALASVSKRELIVFDEPTSGLDGHNMRLTAIRLQELAKKGKNVVLITHDIELIAHCADSVVYMSDGRVTSRLLLERGDN